MAAVELFIERGYDSTSIDEIAERADVARGTFFNYFQRKEDIVSAWGDRRRATLMTTLDEGKGYDAGPTAQLMQCMAALARLNQEEQELTVAMLTAWVKAGRPILEEPYVADVFAEIVRGGIRQGELSTELSPERIGNVLRDVYLGALYRWAHHSASDRAGSLAEELQEVLKLLLNGMATSRKP
ncbi:TetR family transcriptional regulator [Streptomyces sp. NPDC008125]|uniref:TetR/AcrR family transcriptional regulator n=1 Tax=Streptomyces sp. NPDC008125 TaxID=3364811 RepID=UPI0036E177BB